MKPAVGTRAKILASLAKAGLETAAKRERIPLGHRAADACLDGGLGRGALHEIFAHPGHEAAGSVFAAGLAFRASAEKHFLWIGQDCAARAFGEPAATGLLELGITPARMLFVRLAHVADVLRAANDALSSAALGAVVIEIPKNPKVLDLVASKRLALAAARSGVAAFLLRLQANPEPSAAETRWQVRGLRSPADAETWGLPLIEAELVRNRHGRTGRWVMEWNGDDGCFREPHAAHSGAVVSAAFDRSAA
ncbi:MAG: DNA repair protein [Acidobacteriia bacterium]|nr:DNA repair protein [Methyloceanibacter sp.]MCL6492843.1 DNA repair protein [Terriglobia bacterium]